MNPWQKFWRWLTGQKNGVPTAAFTVSANGLVATVVDKSSDVGSTITAEKWDFGDGGSSSVIGGQSHTYAAAGTYTISLIVTDATGQTASAANAVTVAAIVQPPPNGDIGAPDPSQLPAPVDQ